jgi:Fe-S-cluster containining protein
MCPLLDRDGRCSVYAARPLGCRTYYCERARRGVGPSRDDLRELVRELQELAARHEMGGELARPLTRAI